MSEEKQMFDVVMGIVSNRMRRRRSREVMELWRAEGERYVHAVCGTKKFQGLSPSDMASIAVERMERRVRLISHGTGCCR